MTQKMTLKIQILIELGVQFKKKKKKLKNQ